MRKLQFTCLELLLCGLLAGIACAESFQLNDGQTITGEMVIPATTDGVNFKTGPGQYTRVAWTNFPQETLKEFARNPKLAPLAMPFIEVTEEERIKKTEVEIKPVPRLERPETRPLFAALSSSSVGIMVLLLLYAAGIYAAYEVSIFRSLRAIPACGLAAIASPLLFLIGHGLPNAVGVPVCVLAFFIAPIIFLSLPARQRPAKEGGSESEAAVETLPFSVSVEPASGAAETGSGSLRLAHTETGQSGAGLPKTQVFQRGAFTFNRRFFETRFPGFFGIVRREAEKDFELVIKSARGLFVAERISRITANDLHVQVRKGATTEEIMVPFAEVQEVQLKHKDA